MLVNAPVALPLRTIVVALVTVVIVLPAVNAPCASVSVMACPASPVERKFAVALVSAVLTPVVTPSPTLNVIARPARSWASALATTLFALVGTLYGLSVTLGSSRTADITYHLAVLCLLAVIVALLLLPLGRRSLGRR